MRHRVLRKPSVGRQLPAQHIPRCKQEIVLKGKGKATAGDIDGNYVNDGSFLNVTPPPLTFERDGKASASSGEWTSEPDEIHI